MTFKHSDTTRLADGKDYQVVEVRYPAPTSFKPSFAPDTLNVYEGKVQLVAKLADGAVTTSDVKG